MTLNQLSLSLGRQKATLDSFEGDDSSRFGLESCWGSAVSEPRLYIAPFGHPAGVLLFRFGLESCWSYPVYSCSRRFRNHAPQSLLLTKWHASSTACRRTIFFSGVRKQRQVIFREVVFCRLGRAALRRLPLRPWTSFAIRIPVFALYSPRSLHRMDLCATCGASMGKSTCNNTVSHAKLLAAVPGDMNFSVANGAVD